MKKIYCGNIKSFKMTYDNLERGDATDPNERKLHWIATSAQKTHSTHVSPLSFQFTSQFSIIVDDWILCGPLFAFRYSCNCSNIKGKSSIFLLARKKVQTELLFFYVLKNDFL